MEDYKVGDITPNGFEVVSVRYKPEYKMRKRVRIICDYIWCRNEKLDYKGVMGYYYFDSGYNWVETDDGKQLLLKEYEFEFVD
jgi:hypothetical protein